MDLIKLIKDIKSCNPKVIILVGGYHATLASDRILKDFDCVDFICVGAGEYVVYKLIASLKFNRDYHKIRGLGYRLDDQKIIVNGISSIEELNNMPFPIRNFITDISKDVLYVNRDVIGISASRGCLYNCYFCVNFNINTWTCRSPDNVIDEIKSIYRERKFNHVFFVDCNFLTKPQWALEVVQKLNAFHSGITFNFHTRSDQIISNVDLIDQFSGLGCKFINIGVESNSMRVLERYNKNITPTVNKDALKVLAYNSIEPIVYIIMFDGLTTMEDIGKNIEFINDNNLNKFHLADNLYSILHPLYSTEYYKRYNRYYSDDIHSTPDTFFQNKEVELLYKIATKFRAEFDDLLRKKMILIKENYMKDATNQNIKVIYLLIEKLHYIFFEYTFNRIKNGDINLCYEDVLESKNIHEIILLVKSYR